VTPPPTPRPAGRRTLPPADQRDRGSRITDDLTGLVLGCGACFSAVYGLDRAQQTSWTSTSTVSWLALGGIAAVLFVVRERLANRAWRSPPLWAGR